MGNRLNRCKNGRKICAGCNIFNNTIFQFHTCSNRQCISSRAPILMSYTDFVCLYTDDNSNMTIVSMLPH